MNKAELIGAKVVMATSSALYLEKDGRYWSVDPTVWYAGSQSEFTELEYDEVTDAGSIEYIKKGYSE